MWFMRSFLRLKCFPLSFMFASTITMCVANVPSQQLPPLALVTINICLTMLFPLIPRARCCTSSLAPPQTFCGELRCTWRLWLFLICSKVCIYALADPSKTKAPQNYFSHPLAELSAMRKTVPSSRRPFLRLWKPSGLVGINTVNRKLQPSSLFPVLLLLKRK